MWKVSQGLAAVNWLGCEWICVYWRNLLFWAEKKRMEMGNRSEKKLVVGGREESKMLKRTPRGACKPKWKLHHVSITAAGGHRLILGACTGQELPSCGTSSSGFFLGGQTSLYQLIQWQGSWSDGELEEWCSAGAALSFPFLLELQDFWFFCDCLVHCLLLDLMVAMRMIFYTSSLARFKPVLSSPLGQGRRWVQGTGRYEQWSNENCPAQCLWQQRSRPSSGACE